MGFETAFDDFDKDEMDPGLSVNKQGDKAEKEEIGERFLDGSKGSFHLGLERWTQVSMEVVV